jgi:uncharacterized protein
LANSYYHEPASDLSSRTRDDHRGLATLIEELEAIDWYHQRIDVTGDADLKGVLTHLRDEEIEHAAMCLEWLRRRIGAFDEHLREFMFTSKPVSEIAAAGAGSASTGPRRSGAAGLGLGQLEKRG